MDSKTYRNLIGHFATGVTVITTEVDGLLHGMTANAVTSVSLDPILVLVCVDHGTHCHEQMQKADRFGVSILKAGQEELSNLFARSQDPEAGTLRGASFHTTENGVVLLDDCLARIECELHDRIPCGDHDLCIGRVIAGEQVEHTEPLLFFAGNYRKLAESR